VAGTRTARCACVARPAGSSVKRASLSRDLAGWRVPHALGSCGVCALALRLWPGLTSPFGAAPVGSDAPAAAGAAPAACAPWPQPLTVAARSVPRPTTHTHTQHTHTHTASPLSCACGPRRTLYGSWRRCCRPSCCSSWRTGASRWSGWLTWALARSARSCGTRLRVRCRTRACACVCVCAGCVCPVLPPASLSLQHTVLHTHAHTSNHHTPHTPQTHRRQDQGLRLVVPRAGPGCLAAPHHARRGAHRADDHARV
jgi:hypothetical protein